MSPGLISGAVCHYCGTAEDDLRPYGPGMSALCFACMKADPQREAAASVVFFTLIDIAALTSPDGTVEIGRPDGPRAAAQGGAG